MSPIVSGGGGGGSFNGGTITNPLVVDQGTGSESDFYAGDIYLFDQGNGSDAELFARGANAFLKIQQDPTGTGNDPIVYGDISGAAVYFYVDEFGTIITRSLTPPGAALPSSSLAIYLDDSPGATKAKLQAKDALGAIVSADIALA